MSTKGEPKSQPWTPEEIETLTRLWAAGHSAGQISRELSTRSRGAVTGRLMRMGQTRRKTKLGPLAAPKAPREPRQRARPYAPTVAGGAPSDALAALLAPVAPRGERVGLFDLEPGDCRWPLGDPQEPGFGYCAAGRVLGKPYCAGHMTLAYVAPRGPRSARPHYRRG
jgi:GcrA cell cycle regulator